MNSSKAVAIGTPIHLIIVSSEHTQMKIFSVKHKYISINIYCIFLQVKSMSYTEAGPRPLFPAHTKIYIKPNSTNSKEVILHIQLPVAGLHTNKQNPLAIKIYPDVS